MPVPFAGSSSAKSNEPNGSRGSKVTPNSSSSAKVSNKPNLNNFGPPLNNVGPPL